MTGISSSVVGALQEAGFKARSVSVRHLPELQERIDALKRQGVLDLTITRTYLQFEYAALPESGTIFIVAVHQPLTRAFFALDSGTLGADVPPTYIGKADDARVEGVLTSVFQGTGFTFKRERLPVKTLATLSGLATYGKNNIAFVPGFGSYHRLVAFSADCPCLHDNWGEAKMMDACQECSKCTDNCPAHCILPERFLIRAENCLTWYNERSDALPGWMEPDWHNSLLGCMRCQTICPVNRKQIDQIAPGPTFSPEATALLLQAPPFETLTAEIRSKLSSIAMDDSYALLARNLRLLVNNGGFAV